MILRIMAVVSVLLASAVLSEAASGQELPSSAVDALIEHASTSYVEDGVSVAVELDGFPDQSAAAAAALRYGLGSATNDQLVVCSADRLQCHIEGYERLVRLHGYVIEEPGKRIRVLAIVSTEWANEEGGARVFPQMRELIIANDGEWTVVSDDARVSG